MKDSTIIDISEWETPATNYPITNVGTARIIRSKYQKGLYHNYGVNRFDYFQVTKPISVTALQIKNEKWEDWMVDDPPHWWSMQNYARNSTGRVLVAGLGLGLVTHQLLDSVDIDSITVIEINEDVINLISPLLPKAENVKLEIISDDFYKFINETKDPFDRIIIDLWTTGSGEETLKILNEEVRPLTYYIEKLFPDSSVVFHGFGIEW